MALPIIKHILYPYIRLIYVRKIIGRNRIPAKGPAIFVSNHNSNMDGVLLGLLTAWDRNRILLFFMAKEYFKKWHFRFMFGTLFGQIPVNGALDQGLDVLSHGELMGIFPEGRRSSTGKIQRVPHTGLGVLALQSGVPVIPVGIRGTFKVWSRHRFWPKFFGARIVEIRFGKPLRFGKVRKEKIKKAKARAVVQKVMKQVATQAGQTYRW